MTFRWGTTAQVLAMTMAVLMRAASSDAQDAQVLAPIPAPTSAPLAAHPFGQLRFGTLFIATTLALREVGYDTNVFDLSGTERQPGDFTATVEPGVEVGVITRSLAIRTWTRVSFVYYQTYKTEQAINPVTDLTI